MNHSEFYILAFVVCGWIQYSCSYIYTGNSAIGIFVAIAVPLNLPNRNVFVSYNFEANYNLPTDAKEIIPGKYQRFKPIEEMIYGEDDVENHEAEVVADAEAESEPELAEVVKVGGKQLKSDNNLISNEESRKEKKAHKSKDLLTRRTFYKIIRDKLKASGFIGETCLFKLICEVNASFIGKNNGVFGSLLHILLTPSTSSSENLSKKFYKAEEDGVNGDCSQYESRCPHKIMDIFSTTIEDIIYKRI